MTLNHFDNRQRWQAPDVPAELAKRVICACIREICSFRDLMGLKSRIFSWSLLAQHFYTRQLACEPRTERVAFRNGTKQRPVLSIEGHPEGHPETCRLLILLQIYARTNNAKNSWYLKQGSIWKRETKLLNCHYRQAAMETISWI